MKNLGRVHYGFIYFDQLMKLPVEEGGAQYRAAQEESRDVASNDDENNGEAKGRERDPGGGGSGSVSRDSRKR